MTTKIPSPVPKLFFEYNDAPGVGCRLFTYEAGTTTKLATYTDETGGTPNTNPIVLDANGNCDCWLPSGTAYKFTFAPPGTDDPPTNPVWTVDNLSAPPTASAYMAGLLQSASATALLEAIEYTHTGSSTENSLQSWFDRYVWVEDFGAKGDGSTDDSGAIMAAYNALGSGGGVVLFGPKNYAIGTDTALVFSAYNNITFRGAARRTYGDGGTIITLLNVTQNGFTFENIGGAFVEDISFTSGSQQTEGWFIQWTGVTAFGARGVFCYNGWDGFQIVNCDLGEFEDNVIRDFNNDGILINGGQDYYFRGLFMDMSNDTFTPNSGVHIPQTGGAVNITDFDIIHTNYGLLIDPSGGNFVEEIHLANGYFDSANYVTSKHGRGIRIAPTTAGKVFRVFATGVWCATAEVGVEILGDSTTVIQHINFEGLRCLNNRQNGVQATYVDDLWLTDPTIFSNSTSSANTYMGVELNVSVNCTILGGHIGGTELGFTSSQGYAVLLTSTYTGLFNAVGCRMDGNGTGALGINAAAVLTAGSTVLACQGVTNPPQSYTTGAITPTAGATGTITHNLGFNPTEVRAWLVCTTAQLNYSVGDIVPISVNGSNGSSSSLQVASNPSSLNTSTYVIGSSGIGVLNKTGGGSTAINAGDWNLFIKLAA